MAEFIHPTVNGLEEAALYLEARGLTIQDLPIVPHMRKKHGFYTKTDGVWHPLELEGWAFRIKDQWGQEMEGCFLFRPCNYPEVGLYLKDDESYIPCAKPPKFLHVGNWRINWTSTSQEWVDSPKVMIHEKFTCSALGTKLLGWPSIGLSGCGNWSKNHAMIPELRSAVLSMQLHATIYVCLDGDVGSNPTVNYAARSLKGWIASLREDITIIFPKVPLGFGGWDDWLVDKDSEDWVLELNGQGVDITDLLPSQILAEHYNLTTKADKAGRILIQHTASNYFRLISQHPKFKDYVLNMNDQMYELNTPSSALETRAFARKAEMWFSDSVFSGPEAEKVSSTKCVAAAEEVMALPERRISMPHHHIGLLGPDVSEDQALEAAHKLWTEGLRVVGPMSEEELLKTTLRIVRDMVWMWSWEEELNPQWMLCLVGPSGCGKSNFPHSLLRHLTRRGFPESVGKLHLVGDKAKPEEMARVLNGCLIGVLDEYDPPSNNGQARQFETQMLSISSERFINIRKMRADNPRRMLRTASLLLTTTDKNKQFLRTSRGEGIERRAIVLEVEGVVNYYGTQTSNREVIAECGGLLMRWALGARDYIGDPVEFSAKYTHQYIDDDEALRNVAKGWARYGLNFKEAKAALRRDKTNDWRFSPTQLMEMLMPGEKVSREQSRQIQNLAVECGAQRIGQSRVNTLDGKGQVMVDKVLAVADWDAWVEAMRGRLAV